MLKTEKYVTKGSLNDNVRKRDVDKKTGCLNNQKSSQPKVVTVELRAGGDFHRTEKPEQCADNMDK